MSIVIKATLSSTNAGKPFFSLTYWGVISPLAFKEFLYERLGRLEEREKIAIPPYIMDPKAEYIEAQILLPLPAIEGASTLLPAVRLAKRIMQALDEDVATPLIDYQPTLSFLNERSIRFPKPRHRAACA